MASLTGERSIVNIAKTIFVVGETFDKLFSSIKWWETIPTAMRGVSEEIAERIHTMLVNAVGIDDGYFMCQWRTNGDNIIVDVHDNLNGEFAHHMQLAPIR